jgi:antirestriction protein
MKIYVADLAAYNAGKYHGVWIDCDQDEECIYAEIALMLHQGTQKDPSGEVHEEYAIHDFEDTEGIAIGEHTSIKRIVEIQQMLSEHGSNFAVWYIYENPDSTVDLNEAYDEVTVSGPYSNITEYAEEYVTDQGWYKALDKAGINPAYLDLAYIAHDLTESGQITEHRHQGDLYVIS